MQIATSLMKRMIVSSENWMSPWWRGANARFLSSASLSIRAPTEGSMVLCVRM